MKTFILFSLLLLTLISCGRPVYDTSSILVGQEMLLGQTSTDEIEFALELCEALTYAQLNIVDTNYYHYYIDSTNCEYEESDLVSIPLMINNDSSFTAINNDVDFSPMQAATINPTSNLSYFCHNIVMTKDTSSFAQVINYNEMRLFYFRLKDSSTMEVVISEGQKVDGRYYTNTVKILEYSQQIQTDSIPLALLTNYKENNQCPQDSLRQSSEFRATLQGINLNPDL